jgi:hypothetical protein
VRAADSLSNPTARAAGFTVAFEVTGEQAGADAVFLSDVRRMPREVTHSDGGLHILTFTPPAHTSPYTVLVSVSLNPEEEGSAISLVAAGEVRVRFSPGAADAATTAVVHAALRALTAAETPPPPATAAAGSAAALWVRPRDGDHVPTTTGGDGLALTAAWLTAEVLPRPLEAAVVTYDEDTGLFHTTFVATLSGDYVVTLRGGGVPLGAALGVDDGSAAGATVVRVAAGPTSAAKSGVMQLSAEVVAGTRWACTVVARDRYGNAVGYRPWLGGDAFTGALEATGSNFNATVRLRTTDHGDGSYTLHGAPTLVGRWLLNVTLQGEAVGEGSSSSGRNVAVSPAEILTAACVLTLRPAYHLTAATTQRTMTAGETVFAQLEAYDAFGNVVPAVSPSDFDLVLQRGDGVRLDAPPLVATAAGTYTGSWTPRSAGAYTLRVVHRSSQLWVGSAAVRVAVAAAAADGTRTRVAGGGLHGGVVSAPLRPC